MNQLESITYDTETLPYLLFTVGRNIYGISSEFVRSIETLGELTTISGTDPSIRGGVLYQNDFIYLVDIRKVFGLDSQVEEFEKSVQPEQRIKDHENWVAALEKSVRDHTEFTLTDDPHQCAFGRWFYSFKTDNNTLKHKLNTIEAPHQAVHNTAKSVKQLMRDNQYELAAAAIDEMKDTHYKATLRILSSLREIMSDSLNEVYIVIDASNGTKGIIVDSIVGVEYLDTTSKLPESMPHPEYINFLGRRKNDDALIIVLNNSI